MSIVSLNSLTENEWKNRVHQNFDDSLTPKEGETWEKLHARLTKTLFYNPESDLPPLHQAAFLGYSKAIEILAKDSTVANAPGSIFNMTPLHIAAVQGHLSAARILFQKGADPASKSSNRTALDWAMLSPSKNRDFLILFPPRQFLSCETFFHLARIGDTETLKAILKAGYDINTCNPQNENALHTLLSSVDQKSSAPMVKWLIEEGIDVRAKNEKAITPLHIALGKCDLLAAELLIDAGASLAERDFWDNTPLHWGLWKGDPEAIWKEENQDYKRRMGVHMITLSLSCAGYLFKAYSMMEKVRSATTYVTSYFKKGDKRD